MIDIKSKIIFISIIFLFISCSYNNEKENDYGEKYKLNTLRDSTFIVSDTYKHTAKLVAEAKPANEAKFESVILSVKVYPTMLNDMERMEYLKRDSLQEAQQKPDTLGFDQIESKPVEVDFDSTIRSLVITFNEETNAEEIQLFRGIRIADEAREIYIPQKGIVIKF